MRKMSVFGAAVILASAAALPSMAQAAGCAQYDPNCATYPMPKQTSARPATAARAEVSRADIDRAQRAHRTRSVSRAERIEQRQAMNDRYPSNGYYGPGYRSGFWPGDVVGGAVGTAAGIAAGAVNTAGAIATAPFRGPDSYAYYNNGYYGQQSYAERNGFVCTPGTYFKGTDGLRHICQ